MTKTPRGAEYYQNRYFPTLDDAEALLERWRRGYLNDDQDALDAVWVWANEHIQMHARRYFKQTQNRTRKHWYQTGHIERDYDQTMSRIFALLDFISDPKYADRSIGWLITAHRRRFAAIEALRELKEYGIGLPDGTTESSVIVSTWVKMSKLFREMGDTHTDEELREWWEQRQTRYKSNPSEERWQNFLRRYHWYLEIRGIREGTIEIEPDGRIRIPRE